ncbi:MAG: DoxX family membrane protein [Candidatus Promineifilaceae bacterium]|nr:DoxX family membrane protein [Candidatus Promineifilaceae bacterium]
MERFETAFNRLDQKITAFMARYGIVLLRVSLGIVFFWFGVLKFFPGLSPAQDLAIRTIGLLTFDLVPARTAIIVLAIWECLIGLGLIFGLFMRVTLLLLFVQMLGTVTPVFLFPGEVFLVPPYAPTLEGQYIIKNLVLISAGLVIGATVRGGFIISEPGGIWAGRVGQPGTD